MTRLLCVIGAVMALSPAASAVAAPVSSHAMVHTCCSSHELKEQAFAESKALGAAFIRVDVEMGPIFDSSGSPRQQPEWSGLDDVMELSQRYGLPVLGIVLDTPAFLADCRGGSAQAGHCAARDPAEYGRLAGELAAHARGVVTHWEIMNEPDGSWAFEGTAEEYARMLSASYDAIKGSAPEAKVAMGGVMAPTDPAWAERVFATPGADAAHKFDIANIHLRGRVADLPTGVGRWRELLRRHGFSGPLWVTEHGYSVDPTYQQDPAFVGGEQLQAAYLKRSLLALTEAGAEQVFVTLRDNSSLEPNYVSEGLVRIAGSEVHRRPAFDAVRDFARRWPEIRDLLARQRTHERAAASLSQLARADERRLRQLRAGRGDVRYSLLATQRALGRAEAARRPTGARRRELALAKRQLPRLRRLLTHYDGRVRGYSQRLAGNRLEASRHTLAALDCARRIAGG